jgi:hypothetical protein
MMKKPRPGGSRHDRPSYGSSLGRVGTAHQPPEAQPQGWFFLGQLVVDQSPLSDRQADWLATLLERAGLPPLVEGAQP